MFFRHDRRLCRLSVSREAVHPQEALEGEAAFGAGASGSTGTDGVHRHLLPGVEGGGHLRFLAAGDGGDDAARVQPAGAAEPPGIRRGRADLRLLEVATHGGSGGVAGRAAGAGGGRGGVALGSI